MIITTREQMLSLRLRWLTSTWELLLAVPHLSRKILPLDLDSMTMERGSTLTQEASGSVRSVPRRLSTLKVQELTPQRELRLSQSLDKLMLTSELLQAELPSFLKKLILAQVIITRTRDSVLKQRLTPSKRSVPRSES